MVRPVPAGRRGSCCTPYSRLQEEIDNVETIAVTANNTANNASQLAQQAMTRDTFDDVNVNGDLNVYGDIIQQGTAYETHAQHVFSTDDYIVMRDGALVGLAVGDYSGFQVKKYDGTNDGRLVIDKDGTARVGDVGDEQPLATRDESSDLTNDHLVKWDATNLKLVDAGIGTDGMLELYDEGSYTTRVLTPHNTYSVGIPMSAGKSFETGYDYFINVTCISDFEMNIKSTRDIESPGNTSISIQMQAGSTSSPTLTYAVYRISNSGNAPVVNVIGMCSIKQQVKLVSGTNIKTINNTSLLGSGNIQISGGSGSNFTWKNTNNWTQFVSNGQLNEDVLILYFDFLSGIIIRHPTLIPKGTTVASGRIFCIGTKPNGHIIGGDLNNMFTNNSNVTCNEYDDTGAISSISAAKNSVIFAYTKS